MEETSYFITTSQNHPLLLSPNSCFSFIWIQTNDFPILGFYGYAGVPPKGEDLKKHFKRTAEEWNKLYPNTPVSETKEEESFLVYTWKRGLKKK